MNKLTFSVVTSTHPLRKQFALVDNKILKTTAAQMTTGNIRTVTVDDLHGLADKIGNLTAHDALAFGILANGRSTAKVVTKENVDKERAKSGDPDSIVARSREYVNFAYQPGVLMNDHDQYKDEILSPDDLVDRLTHASPALRETPMLWTPSSSYGVHAEHDSTIKIDGGGQRIYIPVQSAALIPDAGRNLNIRQWAHGQGWIQASKSGRPLKRALLDSSVYQPERLDFAGPAILGAGLVREAIPARFLGEGDVLDLSHITIDGDINERALRAMATALEAARPALLAVRDQWLDLKAPEIAHRRGITVEQGRELLLQATEYLLLSGDFLLLPENGEQVSVRDVLDNPTKWHGTRFADPLEPEYSNGDRRIAWVNLRSGGRPYIWSHAHGGIRYTLVRQSARIQVAAGDRGRVTSEAESVIGSLGEIYDYGDGGTARAINGTIRPVAPDWLADYLDRNITFHRRVLVSEVWTDKIIDGPSYLPKRILARYGERGFPKLEGIVTAPTLRRDGSVLDTPGYDHSGLLYVSDSPNPPRVPVKPTIEEAIKALAVLWKPFRDFPFVGESSASIMLSAIISGILRASLPTCPAHAFDAPMAGTGKTILGECVGILATGTRPAITPPTDDDTEARKRLFSILREGGGIVLWDNISGPFGGDAIDAFITAEKYRDRVLGVSESETLPNRALLLVTGNNISTRGDTFRRVLKARLDAKVDAPYLRSFSLNPREYCLAHRLEMVVAALTIVRAWFAAGCPQVVKGNTASFEDWDRLVRQPIAFVADYDLVGGSRDTPALCDVASVFAETAKEAPHKQTLSAVLHGWNEVHGPGERFAARDLVHNAGNGTRENQWDLRILLEDAFGTRGQGVDVVRFGYWLAKHAGERVDGLWFERNGDLRGSAAYVLKSAR